MQIKCFPVATDEEMQRCFDIRRDVFVNEQQVPETLEIDGKDPAARHFGVRTGEDIIATCRVRLMGSAAKIERVAVLQAYRNKGVGRVLMKYLLQELGRGGDIQLFKLSSQAQAVPFYEKLGFKTRGGEYMDAGIPHYDMVLEK
ncbi:MAG: GNAT family N-acetyltransferase [Micavibrio sp.]|nr:GNAT family N-acetyltransferase [Micavibrio sp.]